ncbi:serine hydrolase [Rhodococcus sp. ACT016]|uniref:serine hydrolase n=1 Tax=Rhodococcus sp. ACT016 TaxID=3134808 RepID=UPI003D2AFA8A
MSPAKDLVEDPVAQRARRLAVVCLATAAIAACASPSDGGTTPDSRRADGLDTTEVGPAPLTIEGRITQSVVDAAGRGADVTIALLDRRDGHYESFADATPFPTASVAKLFIADDLFYRESTAELALTDGEHELVARMLEYSDDDAANQLWDDYGTSDIVVDVVSRYGLADTEPPYDDHWWNTVTTGHDLVDYYSAVLDGRGGLDPEHRDEMMTYLRTSNPTAADGYDQSFGIPAGLPDESDVAVKQGWMCCIDDRWTHVSTGVIGPDDRYVLVLVSREDLDYGDGDAEYPDTSLTAAVDDVSAAHARETITDVARTLFPQRRID